MAKLRWEERSDPDDSDDDDVMEFDKMRKVIMPISGELIFLTSFLRIYERSWTLRW